MLIKLWASMCVWYIGFVYSHNVSAQVVLHKLNDSDLVEIDTFRSNPERILFEYYNETISAILSDSCPSFMYNACIDFEEGAYAYVSSHHKISLRFNLLSMLTCEQLDELINCLDFGLMSVLCNDRLRRDHIPYDDISTYDLILKLRNK